MSDGKLSVMNTSHKVLDVHLLHPLVLECSFKTLFQTYTSRDKVFLSCIEFYV